MTKRIVDRGTDQERFWAKVNKTDTCWLWTRATNGGGYGAFRLNGAMKIAHRISYEWLVGPIPKGLELDHLCRNRVCVNPGHLEPVTRQVNVLRGIGLPALNAQKTHCPRGHEYTPENTTANGIGRSCRICRAEQQKEFRHRHPGYHQRYA